MHSVKNRIIFARLRRKYAKSAHWSKKGERNKCKSGSALRFFKAFQKYLANAIFGPFYFNTTIFLAILGPKIVLMKEMGQKRIRDHPFKTSAFFRGGGVKNWPNLLTDSSKKLPMGEG